MAHGLLVTLHLLVAVAFAGTVFVEVVMLPAVRCHLPPTAMQAVERALGNRATAVMPFVLLALYASGLTLAWQYRAVLAQPLASPFGTLLAVKILLALAVFGHFVTAMIWRRRGQLNGRRSRRLHLSVFCHVVVIVVLAKAMFYLSW